MGTVSKQGARHILILGMALLGFAVSTRAAVVTFPDPNLEEAIRLAISKPAGDILDSDLLGLVELDANLKDIISITGIEHCVNIRYLDLAANQIADVSPLADLTGLAELHLIANPIVDLIPLSSLTRLTWLDLGYNPIADLSPLADLTGLTGLYLRRSQIVDLSPLAGLTRLTWLCLDANQITDVNSLAGLTALTTLYLTSNEVADVSPLAGLHSLTCLCLDGNQIIDVSPLAGLTRLMTLGLGSNQISDVGALLDNTGLGTGDRVVLSYNSLSPKTCTDIFTLEARGVTVVQDSCIEGEGGDEVQNGCCGSKEPPITPLWSDIFLGALSALILLASSCVFRRAMD